MLPRDMILLQKINEILQANNLNTK